MLLRRRRPAGTWNSSWTSCDCSGERQWASTRRRRRWWRSTAEAWSRPPDVVRIRPQSAAWVTDVAAKTLSATDRVVARACPRAHALCPCTHTDCCGGVRRRPAACPRHGSTAKPSKRAGPGHQSVTSATPPRWPASAPRSTKCSALTTTGSTDSVGSKCRCGRSGTARHVPCAACALPDSVALPRAQLCCSLARSLSLRTARRLGGRHGERACLHHSQTRFHVVDGKRVRGSLSVSTSGVRVRVRAFVVSQSQTFVRREGGGCRRSAGAHGVSRRVVRALCPMGVPPHG